MFVEAKTLNIRRLTSIIEGVVDIVEKVVHCASSIEIGSVSKQEDEPAAMRDHGFHTF